MRAEHGLLHAPASAILVGQSTASQMDAAFAKALVDGVDRGHQLRLAAGREGVGKQISTAGL